MAGPALPKLRYLLAAALAAGIWVVRQDMQAPRPPERVASTPRATSQPKPTAPKALAQPKLNVPKALALPKTADAPPPRPQKIITGSIAKPQASTRRQTWTTARVRVRARPNAEARILATLGGGRTVWELARSGAWRLVSVDDLAGWVHADYLGAQPRPQLPVPGRAQPEKTKAVAVKKP